MPKKLRTDPIYLAPDILAWIDENYCPCAIDTRSNRELDLNDIEGKIFVYERQVQDWFLNRAKSLVKRKQNNFVVLMIATAYIEGVEQYRLGESSEGKSRRTFRTGIKRVFEIDVSDTKIDTLYTQLRCGLFHNGMSSDLIVLNRKLDHAIEFADNGIIKINPVRFLDTIADDFSNYLQELCNPANDVLRQNFDRMFNVI